MKKSFVTSFAVILVMLPVIVTAQFGFDKADHLKVDSIIYYQNGYFSDVDPRFGDVDPPHRKWFNEQIT